MNYIKHLTVFYEKLGSDDRLTPSHVSLYLALFQCWNMNHFENPFSVNRTQLLKFCKIGSNHTYYKVLKNLKEWGYIMYAPSCSSSKGALINMCIFAPLQSSTNSNPENDNDKTDLPDGAFLHHDRCNFAPFIKLYKQ